ncbi:CU044_5270 family protein [Actinomadura roseirufa]|uniref:CU044_5270 family protein n=1 Tax=Actinomadura roseirufa TaxID=2094049 RepID=UPI00104134FE|nr:CU044_5270 family protein [Actinomadura roseirufa]
MDELTKVADHLTPERAPSAEKKAAARHRLLAEAIAPARRRSRRRVPSRRAVLAFGAAAVVLGASGGGYNAWRTRPLYHPEPLAGYGGPAADFLLAAADAKAKHLTEGQFWYVHDQVGSTVQVGPPDNRYRVQMSQNVFTFASKGQSLYKTGPKHDVPITSEEWNDQREDWHADPVGPADRAARRRDPRPVWELAEPPGEARRGPVKREGAALDFGVEDARRLPADPSKLRAWILNYATKFDHKRLSDPDLFLFTSASDLLVDRPVDDPVRIAMYRLLASLKGVSVVTATDAAGRTGPAVAMRRTDPGQGTVEWQLFIDRATGRLTASQGVIIKPGTENAALGAGTRQFFEVVRSAEWTNASLESKLPDWIKRMHQGQPG